MPLPPAVPPPDGVLPAPLLTRAVVALSLAAFASGLSLRLTDAMLPRLAVDFDVPLGPVAQVVTAFALAYGLAQLFFGPVGDRYGKVRVIAWGSGASAVTAGLCGLAPDFAPLVLARLAAGATAASIIPLSMAWIGDVVPYAQRQPVLARFLIGQIMGVSAGVLLGGYAADHLDWRTPFFIVALMFVATTALLVRALHSLPASARSTLAAEGHAVQRLLREFRAVFAVPWARRVVATVFLEGACVFGTFAFIAAHLHQRHGLALSWAGMVVMVFGFGGLLFALAAPVLVRRLGEVGLTAIGAGVMGASLLVIATAPTWWWAPPACFCCGLGFYMLHNTLQINATQMAPERRGAAVSSFAGCFFLGQAAGVAVAGAVVGWIGTGALIGAGALGVLAVGVNFSRMKAARIAAEPA